MPIPLTPLMVTLLIVAVAAGERPGHPGVGYTPRYAAAITWRHIRSAPVRTVTAPVRLLIAVSALVMYTSLRTGAYAAVTVVAAMCTVLLFITFLMTFGSPPPGARVGGGRIRAALKGAS